MPFLIIIGATILILMVLNVRFLGIKDTAPIRLRNMTDKILKMYVRGSFIGEVPPGTQIDNKKVLSVYNSYLVEAKDESDNAVYSKELDLEALDALDWEIEIQKS